MDRKKHSRRPVTMMSPHVLYEYMDDDGRLAFDYDTQRKTTRFDIGDFRTTMNMFDIFIYDLVDICKEYVAYKLDDPEVINSTLFTRNLN